jgi:hypothetical protein
MLRNEPFWCEDFGVYLRVISNEEADRVCRDVQIYYCHEGVEWWANDAPPEFFREEWDIVQKPSEFTGTTHAVEVHIGKPEYEPT